MDIVKFHLEVLSSLANVLITLVNFEIALVNFQITLVMCDHEKRYRYVKCVQGLAILSKVCAQGVCLCVAMESVEKSMLKVSVKNVCKKHIFLCMNISTLVRVDQISRGRCYKTFYGRHLRIFVTSQNVFPLQTFPAYSIVCG